MKILNLSGRLSLQVDGGAIDVAEASGGRFGPDVQSVFDVWDDFRTWAVRFDDTAAPTVEIVDAELGAPAPRPPQVFAIGLNYAGHAAEAGHGVPMDRPVVFTKFPASITGPYSTIGLPDGKVDWEVELVVVIGRRAENVRAADAWSHVAGLTIGQDLSERVLQSSGPAPAQYNLGKSFTGFAPIGPALVTPDEMANPDDLELSCSLNGVEMQRARTSEMIFSVPDIIAFLSGVVPLLPGDVIFTGTPAGIGAARTPQVFISPGDELASQVEFLGEMRHQFLSRV